MRIVLAGFGAVGQAFARLLEHERAALYASHALSPRLVGVLDRGGAAVDPRGLDVPALLAAKSGDGTVAALPRHGVPGGDATRMIEESDAQLLVEATPTTVASPAGSIERLKAAFRTGKHAVCVNKAPLAVAFPALLELARHNRVELRFSGTVGGGTPMIAMARECTRANRVRALRAVLNGTTNFILWRMAGAGEDFAAALAEAQRLGYAERDPAADVDGLDSATKLVILANGVLGRACAIGDVAVTGIRSVTREQIAAARARGNVIKLVAGIDGALEVAPREVPAGSALDVPANLNALCLELETGGEVTLTGRGAGGPETATAILRDVVDIWRTSGGAR